MALQDKAMLVRVTVHGWTARKKDKRATAEVEANHNATDAGNFTKLLVNKEYLEPYQKQENKIRKFTETSTLAWGNSGERLLPSAAYFDFTSGMRELTDEAERIADQFARDYPQMKIEARQKLGSLYDPLDYPAEGDIRRRFSVEIDVFPVPDAQDFRVDVTEDEKKAIQEQITASVKDKQKQATKECWERLYAAVYKIEEVLVKDKPRIFESLMDTPRELCELLPKLNFADDRDLDKMCDEVRKNLIVQTSDLRKDAKLRAVVAVDAGKLLRKIDKLRKKYG